MTDIRRRILTGLALERTPGFNYSGNFLGVRFPLKSPARVEVEMDSGAHNEDEQGGVDIAAVSLMADVAMGCVVRANRSPEQRLATVSLNLQFTGTPFQLQNEFCPGFGTRAGSKSTYSVTNRSSFPSRS